MEIKHVSWIAPHLSQPVSFSGSLLMLLHTLSKWLVHPHFFAILSTCQTSVGLMCCTTVSAFLHGLVFYVLWPTCVVLTLFCLLYHIKLTIFFISIKYCFFTLCTATLCPTLHLLTCYFSSIFIAVNSFIISVIISSSLILLTNCSFSLLSCLFAYTLICLNPQADHPLLSTFLFFSYQLTFLQSQYCIIMFRFEFITEHL